MDESNVVIMVLLALAGVALLAAALAWPRGRAGAGAKSAHGPPPGARSRARSAQPVAPKAAPDFGAEGAGAADVTRLNWLVERSATGAERGRWHVGHKTLYAGRATSCALQVMGAHVSRRHARIAGEGALGCTIEDVSGSPGALTVNGRALVAGEPTALAHGDVVRLGERSLEFMAVAERGRDEAVLRARVAGQQAQAATAALTAPGSPASGSTAALAALVAARGDRASAARALGVSEEELGRLLGLP